MNRFQCVFCIINTEYSSRNVEFSALLPMLGAITVPWLRILCGFFSDIVTTDRPVFFVVQYMNTNIY